jgi:dihydroorotate dehydrogenase (fumarate)
MDLSTTYMGLKLPHPVVPSASPITETLDGVRRLEDAGASAVVMHSLFEEQITMESQQLDFYLNYGEYSYSEALTYFPRETIFHKGPVEYLEGIRRARESVQIPIIGSLNGAWLAGRWMEYARNIEEAGADGLELNIYYVATDPRLSSTEVEQMCVDVVQAAKATVTIPVAVKLSPYYSAFANMAERLVAAGADALVLFNRFYQPDLDLEALEVVPRLVLSNSNELRLPLRWVAILYGRVDVDFAITSGVHSAEDVLKGLMAGARITMMTSELLQNGLHRIREILDDMVFWMEEREYESVRQLQGSMSQINIANPAAFERANYMKMLHSWRQDPTSAQPGLVGF